MAKPAQQDTPEININLMPGERPSGAARTATHWALTIGRYLIIFTEIVAIAIFALSIKLSADKQGLKGEIQTMGKQISAQSDFEQEFRFVQGRINEIKKRRDSHFLNNVVVAEFLQLLPKGMTLDTLKIEDKELSFSGSFDSPKQLQTLISTFSTSDKLVGLDISELNHPSEKSDHFTFSATAIINQASFEEEAGSAVSQATR